MGLSVNYASDSFTVTEKYPGTSRGRILRGVFRVATFIAFFTVVLLSTMEVAAQTGYEIVCRGGGKLRFDYTPFSNFSPEPQIWITFERGPQRVGSNWEFLDTLSPGQCSWLDRAVSEKEPDRIIFILQRSSDFSISWAQGAVTGISSSLPHINKLQTPTNYQSFFVYNDRRGNFIVTQTGRSR